MIPSSIRNERSLCARMVSSATVTGSRMAIRRFSFQLGSFIGSRYIRIRDSCGICSARNSLRKDVSQRKTYLLFQAGLDARQQTPQQGSELAANPFSSFQYHFV